MYFLLIINKNSIKNNILYNIIHENYNYIIKRANSKGKKRVTSHCQNY